VNKSQTRLKEIIIMSKEISKEQQILEKRIKEWVKIHNSSRSEYIRRINELRVETLEVAEEIAITKCEQLANGTKGSECCEDCSKPSHRVPSKTACKEAGCANKCAFVNATCDVSGEPTSPCSFPFEFDGKEYNSCINLAPIGTTKRPWCKSNSGEVAFCDCPQIECMSR